MRFATTAALSVLLSIASIVSVSAQDDIKGCEALASTSVKVLNFTITGAIGTDEREGFCQVLNAALDTINSLKGRVDDLEGDLKDAQAQVPPDDAILIVDDADGCPTGWTDMASSDPAKFAGRMPLAAIRSEDPNNPYLYRVAAGDPSHTLKTEELPGHRHRVVWSGGGNDHTITLNRARGDAPNDSQYQLMTNGAESGQAGRHIMTTEVGSGSPHNNMPPYIALYFCKKEG